MQPNASALHSDGIWITGLRHLSRVFASIQLRMYIRDWNEVLAPIRRDARGAVTVARSVDGLRSSQSASECSTKRLLQAYEQRVRKQGDA